MSDLEVSKSQADGISPDPQSTLSLPLKPLSILSPEKRDAIKSDSNDKLSLEEKVTPDGGSQQDLKLVEQTLMKDMEHPVLLPENYPEGSRQDFSHLLDLPYTQHPLYLQGLRDAFKLQQL